MIPAWLVSPLGWIWNLAKITIPIPLALLIAFGLWVKLDKASYARKAVDSAVKELVAGSEIRAAEAKAIAMQKIADFERKRSDDAEVARAAEEKAKREFETRMNALDNINADLTIELTELLSRPVDPQCVVGADLYQRLRNR